MFVILAVAICALPKKAALYLGKTHDFHVTKTITWSLGGAAMKKHVVGIIRKVVRESFVVGSGRNPRPSEENCTLWVVIKRNSSIAGRVAGVTPPVAASSQFGEFLLPAIFGPPVGTLGQVTRRALPALF